MQNVFHTSEIDDILSSIDTFVAKNGGPSKIKRATFPQRNLNKVAHFFNATPALPRAYELELIPCQRLLDILFPPFIKLAKLTSATESSNQQPHPTFTKRLNALSVVWTQLLCRTLSGQSFLDSQGIVKPVMSPQKHNALLDAVLEAKFPEVDPLSHTFMLPSRNPSK